MEAQAKSQGAPENPLCALSRNWWLFVLRGALALIIAALAFAMPAASILALTLVFGAFSLVDGVFGLIAAVRSIGAGERWGWLMFNGVFGVLTGIVVIVAPFAATLALATFLWVSIAFWSVCNGAFKMISAIRLRKEVKGEVWLFLGGLLSAIVGVVVIGLLLTRPVESLFALGWLLGFYAAFFGVTMIMLGLRLQKEHGGAATGVDASPALAETN